MKYLIKSCRADRAGVCVNVSVTAPDSRQGTKKTSHRCGDVTKTQNIDMKSCRMHFCISHCQHFSIFLRGCKQANLSTSDFANLLCYFLSAK